MVLRSETTIPTAPCGSAPSGNATTSAPQVAATPAPRSTDNGVLTPNRLPSGANLPPASCSTDNGTMLPNRLPRDAAAPAVAPVALARVAPIVPAPQHQADVPVDRRQSSLADQLDRPPVRKQPKKNGVPDHTDPIYVKTGDHSVLTTEVSETAMYNLPVLGDAIPNFIAQAIPLMENTIPAVAVADHRIYISSNLVAMATQGDTQAAVRRLSIVFDRVPRPIPAANLSVAQVQFIAPVLKSHVVDSDLTPYMHSNTVSAKYTADMLRPYLKPANNNLLPNLADALLNQCTFFDNRAMYAKLVAQALTLEIFEMAGCNASAAPWPAANTYVQFLNLDDDGLLANTVTNLLESNRIVFVHTRDWFDEDLLITHWLASPGYRVDGLEDEATSTAAYLSWPAIPVTILHHGAPVGRPAAALPSARNLLVFAQKLAERRHETDAFTAGIYMALEMVGLRYSAVAGRAYPLHSNLNAGTVQVPQPADYNFMLRAAKIYPSMRTELIPESLHFMGTTGEGRVRIATLYNACISTFNTTFLHSLSICVQNIVQWGMNADPNSFVQTILNTGICIPRHGSEREAVPYFMPKAAIKHFLGLVPLAGTFAQATWNGRPGELPDIAHSFLGQTLENAPRLGTVLAIDDFLLSRPQEWAILGPHTKVDLSKDLVVTSGRANSRGVRTYLGEALYGQRALSSTPYLFVPYGNQVVNAIHQHFRMEAGAVAYNHKIWNAGSASEWDGPDNYAVAPYIGPLHLFEPCTLGTYNYTNKEVRAPCMVGNALDLGQRTRLTAWKGQELDNVGISLAMNPNDRFKPFDPPPIAAFEALGMFADPPAKTAPPAPTDAAPAAPLN